MIKLLSAIILSTLLVLMLTIGVAFANHGNPHNIPGCEGRAGAQAGYCPGVGFGDPVHQHGGPPGLTPS